MGNIIQYSIFIIDVGCKKIKLSMKLLRKLLNKLAMKLIRKSLRKLSIKLIRKLEREYIGRNLSPSWQEHLFPFVFP